MIKEVTVSFYVTDVVPVVETDVSHAARAMVTEWSDAIFSLQFHCKYLVKRSFDLHTDLQEKESYDLTGVHAVTCFLNIQ